MSRKLSALLVVALLFGAFGGFGASAALAAAPAAPGGAGPGNPLSVPSAAQTVAVGQRVWYAFQYVGDKSEIVVDMNATPGGSASFAVWTQGSVQSWQSTGTESPVGRGAANNNYGGDLVWAGNFNQSGTYYIVVDQTGGSPANITLKVTGSGVSAIAAPAAAAPASAAPVPAAPVPAAPAQAAPVPAAPVPAAKGGTGPENALPAPSAAQTVAVGQRVWYAFQYAGDKSQIVVDMNATPGGSANFAIWTQGNVQNWQSTGTENPVGRGASNNSYGGDLVWTGNFNQAGTYYIVVNQTGGGAATITLKVTGTGVSGLGK
jgi:hypothetical protein